MRKYKLQACSQLVSVLHGDLYFSGVLDPFYYHYSNYSK